MVQKQPDSHRGTNHKEGNAVVGGNYMTSRRIANIHLSEDCPVTTFVLQDPNQRWIFLVPLPLSVERSKQCRHLGSTMHDTDAAVVPPVHLVWVCPQQNQMIHPNEGSGSSKYCSHSTEKPLRKSNLRNKRSRSLKSTSNEWLPRRHLPNNSSDLVCENSSLIVSEALGDGFPKVDKTAKRSPRKKGKKKGKRCKRSLHKKDVDTEMLPGRSLHQSTTFEKPLYSDPSCLGEGISESNSSHSAISSGLSMQLLKEKSDEDNRSNHVNHLTEATSETPFSDNMDESEPTVSFSDEFVGENISLHNACQATDSCSKNSIPGSTIPPSFFQEDINASSNELSSFPCSQIKTIEKEKYSSSSICGPSHFDDGVVEKPNGRIQACSSSSQSCTSYRKESHERRPGSSSNAHRFPNINARGGTGKETVNSFWQRVQKKDAEECTYGQEISVSSSPQEDVLGDNCGPKRTSFASKPIRNHKSCRYPCSDETSAQSNSNTFCSAVTDSNDLQCKPRGGRSLTVFSEKFQTKSGLISNQEVTHYGNRKAFHRGRTNDSKFLKGFPQHDELLNKSKTTHCEEAHDSTPLSSCSNDIQDNTGSHPSELQDEEGKQITQEGKPAHGHSCSHACGGTTEIAQTLFCPLSGTSNYEHNCSLEMLSTEADSIFHKEGHHYVSHVDDGDVVTDVKLDTGGICAEHGKQGHYPGCTIQKWIPVEKKPVAVSSTEHKNELVSDKENALEIESDNRHIDTLLDQTGPLLPHSKSRQETACCSTFKTIGQASSLRNSVSKTNSRHGNAGCNSSLKMEECMLKLDTDLDKIVKAVNDAYCSQTISESYHSHTGIPLAEFERVLQSASPVIGDIHNLLSCKSCSQYQLIVDSLHEHQMPGISLGNLWSWFEKPGTYGLEVKVEDRNLKSIGNARSEFQAYFVPYLSAVQVFSRTKCSTVSETCSSDGKCRDTSMPLTQKEESTLSPNRTDSSATDENCDQSVDGNELDEAELLFEYFESDPPQQRLPLFEKIKELARGDVSSTCKKISGDPSTLQYLHLNDIHPASWYSVSWYPIYRIPDGNFRAAFLTYHSLGYFIKRNFESAPNGRMQIISPVVGLQSYNSKGECWFQQSKCTKEQPSSLNPSEILKERLRTLEQTASVMARASFSRGGSKVVNRQPDYEFFLSRKW